MDNEKVEDVDEKMEDRSEQETNIDNNPSVPDENNVESEEFFHNKEDIIPPVFVDRTVRNHPPKQGVKASPNVARVVRIRTKSVFTKDDFTKITSAVTKWNDKTISVKIEYQDQIITLRVFFTGKRQSHVVMNNTAKRLCLLMATNFPTIVQGAEYDSVDPHALGRTRTVRLKQ